MAKPKGIPPDLLGEPSNGPGEDASDLPDPLAGFHLRPGTRGPRTTLTKAMIPVIAESLARTGVQRIAAAKAGTTEDCLGKWLTKGRDAVARRKASLYTELLFACEQAWAHRFGFLIELGERTVTDRHCNPRFITWLMQVTAPKQFTVPREPAAQAQGGALGPAFELVSPEAAAKSVREKLLRFLEEDDKSRAPPPEETPPPSGEAAPAEAG
ncbi:hypothetical protein D187_008725 [Cystobacter fuscus DSM 2262]|uniref:Uncharacterized protein n=1 Tax=Cystobacter fuscus (strain ATCC 25194 / DSM 2262 / NBRC 100088 / M29) TaxID=1242864 RepID=S9PJE8_CYSF2|nr:hypothetical protein [Cystobacter fuscus]EPX62537.1 hypothetical protein D187_008725 [Cystobacter fuscus DSM 2262]